MTYRTHPVSGDRVSLLGYGMMRLPRKELTLEDGSTSRVLDQDQVNLLVDKALEGGINFFDTAPAYPGSEEATGIALSRHDRKDYFICTKMSNKQKQMRSRQAGIAMFEESFRRLRVDTIDYYLMHNIGSGEGFDEFKERFLDNGLMDFLLQQREKGRIRHLGFSFHGDYKVFKYMMDSHERYHWDIALIQMNYVDWESSKSINPNNVNASQLYSELREKGIPNLVMEPLLGGRLSNLPEHMNHTLKALRPYDSIASWAFRFCGSQANVLSHLSGMSCLEHLEDNLKTFSPLSPISDEESNILLNMARQYAEFPIVPCNYCNYCLPCPYGIAITDIFRHYNKCVTEGTIPSDSQAPEYRRLRRRFLKSYAREVLPERAADKCIGCQQCKTKCPQRIDIPRAIRKVDNFVEKLRREQD